MRAEPKKLNILEISFSIYPFIKYGGMEKHVYYLSKKFQKKTNVKVIVCTNERTKIDLDIFKVFDIKLPMLKGLTFLFFTLFYIFYLKIRKQVNIIHIHGANITNFPIVLLSKFLKLKVVLTIHGKLFNKKIFFKKYLESFSGIICVSKDIKNKLRSYYEIDNIATIVIPNGICLENFSFKEIDILESTKWLNKNFSTGKYNVFFLGRLVKEKGLMDIVEISKKMPNVKFFVGGTGPLEVKLREISNNLKNLVILGFIKEDDLKKFFLSCDICIFPSHIEPFGIVILEAMAYGKPIIASKTGGIVDILPNNTGILVEPKNIDGFVKTIKKLENKKIREQFSAKSIKRVKKFSWKRVALKTLLFFEKL